METKSAIAQTWDKIAKQYKGYRRKNWSKFDGFLKDSKAQVLDIGCGNASYLRKKDIGIDMSFETCKLAAKKCKTVCADAVYLPIKAKSFSRIISRATIHHMPTKQDRLWFLQEIKRVLAPRGKALVTGWYRWQKKHLPKAIFTKSAYIRWGDTSRFYHLFSKQELTTLASKVFNKFEVRVEKGTTYKNLYLYVYK